MPRKRPASEDVISEEDAKPDTIMDSEAPAVNDRETQTTGVKRKRQRAKNTEGLLSPEQVAKKPRTVKNGDHHEEEEAEDNDDDQGVDSSNDKGAAVETRLATTHLENGAKDGDMKERTPKEIKPLAPLENLRVPSEQTPGNLRETARPPASLVDAPDIGRRLIFDTQPPTVTRNKPTLGDNHTHYRIEKEETVQLNQQDENPKPDTQEPREGQNGDTRNFPETIEELKERICSFTVHLCSTLIETMGQLQSRMIGPQELDNASDDREFESGFGVLKNPLSWFVILLAFQVALYPLPVNFISRTASQASLVLYNTSSSSNSTKTRQNIVMQEDETSVQSPIHDSLEALDRAQGSFLKSLAMIDSEFRSIESYSMELGAQIKGRDFSLGDRYYRLQEAQEALSKALKEDDLSSHLWSNARKATAALGRKLLNVSALDLWEIKNPRECAATISSNATSKSPKSYVDQHMVEQHRKYLRLQAQMAADKIITSPISQHKVRGWIRQQIESISATSQNSVHTFPNRSQSSSNRMDIEQVQMVIQERIEIERADRTGEMDYASLLNGAKIIRGGKRGTTNSLVDSLPVLNRLMHLLSLRFYGYGPEAALTPTYPPSALGQCWAFEQTPLKEQLKRRRSSEKDEDHKRGNFGTLTISLPYPVLVNSVVIEHPAKSISQQAASAIRSFRIIGYEDEMATKKSWSLGSFEYNISKFSTSELARARHIILNA